MTYVLSRVQLKRVNIFNNINHHDIAPVVHLPLDNHFLYDKFFEMLCLNMQIRYYLMPSFGKFRRNLPTKKKENVVR